MKVGNTHVVKHGFPFGRVIGWTIFAAIMALAVTGGMVFVGRTAAEDEANTLAVRMANEAALPGSIYADPFLAWQEAQKRAQLMGATIPVESFFINPDRSVSFIYEKGLNTPIWSQIPPLQEFTVVKVDAKGSVSTL